MFPIATATSNEINLYLVVYSKYKLFELASPIFQVVLCTESLIMATDLIKRAVGKIAINNQ